MNHDHQEWNDGAEAKESFDSEAERILVGLSREAAMAAEKHAEVAKAATRDAAKANRYAEALGGALDYFRKAAAEPPKKATLMRNPDEYRNPGA